jgi:hypothetical protein
MTQSLGQNLIKGLNELLSDMDASAHDHAVLNANLVTWIGFKVPEGATPDQIKLLQKCKNKAARRALIALWKEASK